MLPSEVQRGRHCWARTTEGRARGSCWTSPWRQRITRARGSGFHVPVGQWNGITTASSRRRLCCRSVQPSLGAAACSCSTHFLRTSSVPQPNAVTRRRWWWWRGVSFVWHWAWRRWWWLSMRRARGSCFAGRGAPACFCHTCRWRRHIL